MSKRRRRRRRQKLQGEISDQIHSDEQMNEAITPEEIAEEERYRREMDAEIAWTYLHDSYDDYIDWP